MDIDKILSELRSCHSFKDFFIKISELKLELSVNELRELLKNLNVFSVIHGAVAIVFVKDTISSELALRRTRGNGETKKTEKDYQIELVESFDLFFPDYSIIKEEFFINGRRIDILSSCKKTNKKVIMELKLRGSNPARQLRHYDFLMGGGNILMSISETEIKNKEKGIIYKTFDQIFRNPESEKRMLKKGE